LIFVVPDQVHLLDLTGPAHIFYEAMEMDAPFEISFVRITAGNDAINSSSGLGFANLVDFNTISLGAHDYIFIPGIDSKLLFSDSFKTETLPFQHWLQVQHAMGVHICSVCTGAFIVAESGILNGKPCTTHWRYMDRFREQYPKALVESNRLFISNEKITTSAGVASGIDMALYLVEQIMGPVFALKVAREVVVYTRRTEADPQLSIFLQHRNHMDNRIHSVQDYLSQHLSEKVTIEQLAELVCMSPRNLSRLFKATTQLTIGEYHHQLRLEKIEHLRTENHKQETIAKACGVSPSQLRHILRKKDVPYKLVSL
jgi:transcriptional regulator GlxA family with amidase domain